MKEQSKNDFQIFKERKLPFYKPFSLPSSIQGTYLTTKTYKLKLTFLPKKSRK